MQNEPLRTMLGKPGEIVESDETWVGPRFRPRGTNRNWQSNKTAVVALVERDGKMRTHTMPKVTPAALSKALSETVDSRSRLHTDGYSSYKKIGERFASHETVDHTKGEYARGDVHVNSAEATPRFSSGVSMGRSIMSGDTIFTVMRTSSRFAGIIEESAIHSEQKRLCDLRQDAVLRILQQNNHHQLISPMSRVNKSRRDFAWFMLICNLAHSALLSVSAEKQRRVIRSTSPRLAPFV